METLTLKHKAKTPAPGEQKQALVGVVTSGNLEVLFERVLPAGQCEVTIATPMRGFDDTWRAVVNEFVDRCSPGGLRVSINDGGARPDTVFLRLMQGMEMMGAE